MTATAEAPPTSTGYTHRQIQLVLVALMSGMLLAVLDQTIVTTALTTISRDFHQLNLYGWVVTSYLLTSTATTPLYGKISDQFGRKRIFQAAIVIFLIGSALSGLSQNMYQLIIFRGVQGLGAGGLMTLAMAIVGDIIPPRERGRYQGYFGAVFGVASVLGPLLGGILVDQASWRWVFYVNLPIGAAALVLINRVLRYDHATRRRKIDVLGSVLIVSGVSLFLVGVQLAGTAARITGSAWAFAIPGLLLVGVFIWWESRAVEPILPLWLFKNRSFTIANVLSFITGAVMFGAIIFLPQYFQRVRGVSPTLSGLQLLPILAGLLIMSIGSGYLITRLGRYKIFVLSGTGLLAAGLGWMTLIRVDSNIWLLAAMMFVVGSGIGLFMQTLVLSVQNSVSYEDMGTGTATVTFFRTLGGAIGAAVLGAILVEQETTSTAHYVARFGLHAGPLHAFTHGMDVGFLYSVPAAVVSFLLAFFLREIKLRTSSAAHSDPASRPDQPGSAFGSDGPDPGGRSHSPRGPNPSPAIEPL